MALGPMGWTAIILAVVILSLTFLPNASSLAIVILLGMIKKKTKTTADRSLPVFGPGAPPDTRVRSTSPALGASPEGNTWLLSDPPPPGGAPPPAGGAPPPAGPRPAGSAPPPAVDALVPSGRMRSEPESSSTPSSLSGFEHDVFLSFSGLDTRERFTGRLSLALQTAGIRVFMDCEELLRGKEIGSKLKEAIKRSRISIAIISLNYASSKLCLDVLVQMWECRESNGQIIIPIFDHVSPSDVIHQTGGFGKGFLVHSMSNVDSIAIETWKEVLGRIGQLRGFDVDLYWAESELVNTVVNRVVHVLRRDDQFVTDRLVGIDHHVQEMMKKLGVAHSEGQAVKVRGEEVRIVGIWGEPGVGKTTLAKVVFNKTHKLFDAYSFLEDISSEGVQFSRHMLIADLQKQKCKPLESSGEEIESLCRNVKVLIVLDDVDKDELIKELAGKLTWFSPGSRIIVTTDKRNVLMHLEVAAVDRGTVEQHRVRPMSEKNALDLFHKHAFQGVAADDVSEYDSLSRDIVKAIGGLPSEIVQRASILRRNMNIDTWKTTLDLLQKKRKKKGKATFQVSHAGKSELGNFH